MCGRYNITDSPAIQQLLERLGIDIGPLPTRYNIAPTDPAPCIFHDDDHYAMTDMRWWLTPSWSDGPSQKFAMFNARAENVETSRAYRGPFKHHRGIMPATSFIEWQQQAGGKQPFSIEPESGALFFAALWDCWDKQQDEYPVPLYSCSMMTTEAVECFRSIHHRQPVMLNEDEAVSWLDPETPVDQLKVLLSGDNGQRYIAIPVDNRINNARNKSKPVACGEPLVLGG